VQKKFKFKGRGVEKFSGYEKRPSPHPETLHKYQKN